MKCSKAFFLFIVFATGCAKSDFTAKQQSSQLDPSLLAKILAPVSRRVSYTVSYSDYADFVANSRLGAAETSESAYCKLNRTDATRFSNRYTRTIIQVFNSFQVEIPASCDSFQGFGETVGEMGCQDPNGCGGYEPKTPGEYEPKTPGENEPKTPGENEPKTSGENEPKDPSPTIGFPGSECKVSWEFIPGSVCYDFFPGLLLCCPQ